MRPAHRLPRPVTNRDPQRGSIIVIVAALSIILVGVAGLAIDGGEITIQYRAAQNAADASALAAAIQVTNGSTESVATQRANIVAAENQVTSSDLTLTYYNSSGIVTSVSNEVASVSASVRHTFSTLFLPIMGIDTSTVSTTATATLSQSSACVICLMDPSASGALSATANAGLNVKGGDVQVNSSSATALQVTSNGSLSVSGGGIDVKGGDTGSSLAQINPTPTLGATTVSDPYASVPVPVVVGTQTCCAATLNPGIYTNLVVSGNTSVTMNPGTYVVTNSFAVTGNGSLVGHDVTIYLACADYPTPCTSGQAGAKLTLSGNGTVNLSPPSYGTYQGMTIFSDRNNTSPITVGGNGETRFLGSLYALSAAANLSGNGLGDSLDSRIIVDKMTVSGNASLDIQFSGSGNYQVPNSLTLTV
ncbi:MAG TPA: pilus assembly protein TadG-related protein [Candidatus Acidoferrales bacterium]|nr:pilus assembly protein TadG-related protein [Candidatus Acidoferrales bacterium]